VAGLPEYIQAPVGSVPSDCGYIIISYDLTLSKFVGEFRCHTARNLVSRIYRENKKKERKKIEKKKG
jgi:hypothetical protein